MNMRITICLMILIMLVSVSCKKENVKQKNVNEEESVMTHVAQETVKLEGYVMDIACGSIGKGMDGSEITHSPQDHTKKCLLFCKESGFGIMTKNDEGFYQLTRFDSEGSNLALALIEASNKDKGIFIQVEGTLNNNLLTVTDIIEK
ncbi:MAG: hypothetical protein MJB14_11330 [Spirochaetes bacterium]|nr:hypothetical protein [Spirochaetota bacterium]